jgi:hypothetical protein
MIFSSPIPFKEALASQSIKTLMPTAAKTAELRQLGPDILARARFSAQTTNVGYLAKMDKLLTTLVSPASQDREAGPVLDTSATRLALKQHLASIGYAPEEGKAGGLTDLSSDRRLNLIIDTNIKMAHGYGNYAQMQDPDLLDVWPCQELIRVEDRDKKRNWDGMSGIWRSAGGQLFGGRMIARKDDQIWTRISAFGNPYPPFDFGSGMGVRDVDRSEAEALGVIKRSTVVAQKKVGFNEAVETPVPQGISKALAQALFAAFKGIAKIEADKFIMAGGAL